MVQPKLKIRYNRAGGIIPPYRKRTFEEPQKCKLCYSPGFWDNNEDCIDTNGHGVFRTITDGRIHDCKVGHYKSKKNGFITHHPLIDEDDHHDDSDKMSKLLDERLTKCEKLIEDNTNTVTNILKLLDRLTLVFTNDNQTT